MVLMKGGCIKYLNHNPPKAPVKNTQDKAFRKRNTIFFITNTFSVTIRKRLTALARSVFSLLEVTQFYAHVASDAFAAQKQISLCYTLSLLTHFINGSLIIKGMPHKGNEVFGTGGG